MLEENGVEYEYRDYRKAPLSEEEIRSLLLDLGLGARQVLRTRDRAFQELALTGSEDDDQLIRHMTAHPTLLDRPIGVLDGRAVLGRPPDRLLSLLKP